MKIKPKYKRMANRDLLENRMRYKMQVIPSKKAYRRRDKHAQRYD